MPKSDVSLLAAAVASLKNSIDKLTDATKKSAGGTTVNVSVPAEEIIQHIDEKYAPIINFYQEVHTSEGVDAVEVYRRTKDILSDVSVKISTREAVYDLTEALRLTVEYVGNDVLPPIEGWSWYDALLKYAPEKAQIFADNPQHLGHPTLDDYQVIELYNKIMKRRVLIDGTPATPESPSEGSM